MNPDKAISTTVMKWAERGFYGYTDRAGRRQRADDYARTVIKTTARRTFNEMRMRPAQELGIDTFYYSIKPAAREMCAPLQHQIVTTGQARGKKARRYLPSMIMAMVSQEGAKALTVAIP